MTEHDRRLIEDYLLIEAISAEASREKSVRKGHIRKPVKHLDHAKREVIAARHYDIPANAIEAAAQNQRLDD
jgi:putative DNA methylase